MTFEDEDYDEAELEKHERRITRCSSAGCRARIVWLETKQGKRMPVDADSVQPGQEVFDTSIGHISHFSTCVDADKFRKPRA